MALIQRKWPGRMASSAGTKSRSQTAPNVLATGLCTARERNQRTPSMPRNRGSRNDPTPQNCRTRSEVYDPAMPIQLRAECDAVRSDWLLSEGSSGEYDDRAKKSRRAEMHNRNPNSSFRRRFLVGAKIF